MASAIQPSLVRSFILLGVHDGAAPTLDTVADTFRALATWADAVVVDGAGRVGFDGLALGHALQLPFADVVGSQAEEAVAHARALVRGGLEAVGWLGDPAAQMPGE
jgi:citrate lyase beta subunit